MKHFKYIMIALMVCLAICGCKEVDDFPNTLPTVKTDAVEKYTGRNAYVSGSVSSRATN